ncbi:MAG: hypothetical protein GTO63_28880 [Anaerolineae bacterium]|nr:hypothetical protein [Anaerolineae bacterium]NIQ81670.1 hypothetical protein [Anaerolineae bacterium]
MTARDRKIVSARARGTKIKDIAKKFRMSQPAVNSVLHRARLSTNGHAKPKSEDPFQKVIDQLEARRAKLVGEATDITETINRVKAERQLAKN